VNRTQKLLDLSLRNRLLNVRDTRLVIPIVCPDISALEDKLASDESFSLKALAELWGEKDLHDLAMTRNCEIKSDEKKLLEQELEKKRLWASLTQEDLDRRLTTLYRQGKNDLEEGGVNTLFLAIGFLEWKVAPRDKKSYLAPILLVPIRLQRKSIVEGIRISRIDEDTIVNETLLELLRSQYKLNIPGLSPLPTDQSGVDVGLVMQIIRQTIKNMPGWEVREEARIGLFSFGKFIMWTDMTSRAELLKQNPLVKYLMDGGGDFDDGVKVFPPEEIEKRVDLEELFCPVSADSSQLTAVLYSTLGKSFVLHGPSGTGKSQTITNIIAQNLAAGKKILFVSEKKAALDVVHKRLSAIGLRPFCLELHSNKAGKTDVLAQFSEALNVSNTAEPEQWDAIVSQIQKLQKELNQYVTHLHKRYPNGLSAYDCFSRLLGKRADGEELKNLICTEQDSNVYSAMRQLVSDLARAHEFLDEGALPALSAVDGGEWSPVFERDMVNSAKKLRSAAEEWKEAVTQFSAYVGLPVPDDFASASQVVALAEKVQTMPDIPETFLTCEFESNLQFLGLFGERSQKVYEQKRELGSFNLDVVRNLDLAGIKSRIEQNAKEFLLIRFFKNMALLNELSGLKKVGGSRLTIGELTGRLPDFALWCESVQQWEPAIERGKALLGDLWQEETTDWTAIQAKSCAAGECLTAVQKITGSEGEDFDICLAKLKDILPAATRNFAQETAGCQQILDLLEKWNALQNALREFARFSTVIPREKTIAALIERLNAICTHREGLRNVMRYCKHRNIAVDGGLAEFVAALEEGRIRNSDASSTFETIYAQKMLNEILEKDRTLAQFNGLDHEQRIQKFCELDDLFTGLARKIVFAKLASALPRRRNGDSPPDTELGLLKRECAKKARQKPVRQLLAEIPLLAPRLKPCFLMSPLSVAQYLPPDTSTFDLIIFDEASQIPVWDAIGVIARGKQLIVVGDPKQMPPTNFFQKGDSPDIDEAQEEEVEDAESILDECLAAGVSSCYLNWHYRSRHEDLISFSNHYYYNDRLFTFPAAQFDERFGVRFRFVPDAIYDRRNSRTNRKEAEALVRYIFEQLEAPSGKKRSIGVVTFSDAQKTLIEDLLEDERRNHPALESYFSDQNEEPLFVKNLENVQGDERDVILFSICYAQDAEGKFTMNFGPLNRQGGERRLNVAITRAKEQVVVFASIHASQIELSRTNATGAAHLKYFLDYAEKGVRAHAAGVPDASREAFASVIADCLKQHGYAVERNVGSSEFRIDLAVRDPESPDAFLLGIECDGPAYAAQRTARDRDHLRHDVLRSLGWHIHQAWTIDWGLDRKQAEIALLKALENARTSAPEPPAPPSPEPFPEPPVAQKVPEEKKHAFYVSAHLSGHFFPEDFYNPQSLPLIRRQMEQIIEQEAPIYERLLKKRITRAWGFNRTGDNIQAVLNAALPRNAVITQVGDGIVYWSSSQDPALYCEYRMALPEDGDKRAINEIPPEELANAMYELLVEFSSCGQDTLFRETVKLFGLFAVTQKARKYLEYALGVLKTTGRV